MSASAEARNGVASLGQLLSPYLVAQVTTRWGWDALFASFVAVALLGSAITASFWNYRPAEPTNSPQSV